MMAISGIDLVLSGSLERPNRSSLPRGIKTREGCSAIRYSPDGFIGKPEQSELVVGVASVAWACGNGRLLIPPPRSGGEGRPRRSRGQGGGRFLAPPTLTLISFASSLPTTRFARGGRD